MRRIPLVIFVVLCAAFTVALVSCRENATQKTVEPVNTMWSATTVPTTQTAKQLGFNFPPAYAGPTLNGRKSAEDALSYSRSCVVCHTGTDAHSMHERNVTLACVDCHGGKHDVAVPDGIAPD